jgi:hypothetical protein
MGDLIALLERKTDRRFDQSRLDALMQRIDEQERALWEAARAIGEARRARCRLPSRCPTR